MSVTCLDQISAGVLLGSEQNNGHTKLNIQITIQYQSAKMGIGNNKAYTKLTEPYV
jgi:hypothetical protein